MTKKKQICENDKKGREKEMAKNDEKKANL